MGNEFGTSRPIVFYRLDAGHSSRQMYIESWRKWAADAEVISHAE